VVALAAASLAGGDLHDGRTLAVSLATYPLYAAVQLALVLGVTWPSLRRLGDRSTAPAVTAAALLFALVHWPNPLLMALTGLGMLLWAREYGRGRPPWHLAVSMGLLATLAAQGLPDPWTEHMRAGPGCVRQRAVPVLAADAGARTAELAAGRTRTLAFLAALYPATVGRTVTDAELDRWWSTLEPCRRGVLAWRFYISEEYRRKFGEPAGEAPLPGDVHWTALPPPWPGRIGGLTGPAPADGRDAPGSPAVAPDRAWRAHLERLYRTILRREPSAAELAAWSPALSPRQQERLVEVLLERRRELARAPFDTLGCRALRLHH
jgi:hypothetical protein